MGYMDDLAIDERRTFDTEHPSRDGGASEAYYEFERRHRDLLAGLTDADLSDALFDHMPTIHAHARNGAKPAAIGQAVLNVLDCYCASVAARIVWGEGVVKVLTEEEGRTLGLIGVATRLGERA